MSKLSTVILAFVSMIFCSWAEEPSPTQSPLDQKQGVLQEVWFNIAGNDVADLTRHEEYQKSPQHAKIVSKIDFTNLFVPKVFGQRFTTLIVPEKTGDYRFHLASDDASELWLSKNSSDKDMSCIAFVRGFTYHKGWFSQASQISEPIHLEAGKAYLLIILHKESGSPNHIALAWTGPDIEKPTIIPENVFHLPEILEKNKEGILKALATPAPASAEK